MATPYLESDPRFYNRLVQVANNVGLQPEDILVVMALESGINSSIYNNNYGGLTQISNSTLKGLGYNGNVKDFSNEPAYKQLDYVEKHIQRLENIFGGQFEEAAQYYVGNLLPVSLKLPGVREKNPNTIIVAQNPDRPHLPNVSIEKEKVFYNSNKGLDLDRNGAITYGDIQNFLNKKRKESHYTHAITQLPNSPATTNNPVSSDTNKTESFLDQLNKFLENILASNKKTERNDFTIFVMGSDLDTSIEFSRVLTSALREVLKAKATSHIHKNKVEVSCNIEGPKDISKKIVQAFSDHLAECFYNQTQQIGGLRVCSQIISETKSNYDFIDYRTASLSYRKFLTKFMKV